MTLDARLLSKPTHVLHWVPGYLIKGGAVRGDGWWELQTVDDYEADELQTDPDWILEGDGRDIDAAEFTEWIASLTGYPVTVEKSWVAITCWRVLRFRRPEPLWYVSPAEGA
jgi:hypothetical protein